MQNMGGWQATQPERPQGTQVTSKAVLSAWFFKASCARKRFTMPVFPSPLFCDQLRLTLQKAPLFKYQILVTSLFRSQSLPDRVTPRMSTPQNLGLCPLMWCGGLGRCPKRVRCDHKGPCKKDKDLKRERGTPGQGMQAVRNSKHRGSTCPWGLSPLSPIGPFQTQGLHHHKVVCSALKPVSMGSRITRFVGKMTESSTSAFMATAWMP